MSKSSEKRKRLPFKSVVENSWWALKVAYKMSPQGMVLSLITKFLLGIRSFANLYVFSLILDKAIETASVEGSTITDLLSLLLVYVGISVFFSIVTRVMYYARFTLFQYSHSVSRRMMFERLRDLGVQATEDPEIQNAMKRAEDSLYQVRNVAFNILDIIAETAAVIVSVAILIKVVPWTVAVLFLTGIVSFFIERISLRESFEWYTNEENTERRRVAGWVVNYLMTPRWLGEVLITGAHDHLANIYNSIYNRHADGYEKIFRKDMFLSIAVDLLDFFVLLFAYIQTFQVLFAGVISVGSTAWYLGTVDSLHQSLFSLGERITSYMDTLLKVEDVHAFYKVKPKLKDGDIKLARLEEPPTIKFENVTFAYPNTDIEILKDFNFEMKAGEKVAIVGENGAGKSTIVKLLCRIYDPQKGEILVNGQNIKNLKIDDWYKNIGVLFQDFNEYGSLTAEQNIYMGKSIKPMDKEKVIEAAKNAEAYDFIMKYPKKFKTILNERFTEGISPSKGQKQKIAIARFFYRNAPFAIFDEPTSAIDAQAEYRIFDRIYNFFGNKSVVIISHRFSTVRSADRILVLEDGKVAEEGSHEELFKKDGIYADSFKKQAEGYL